VSLTSVPDAEMRIDEELPAAAVAARHAILAARDRPDSGLGPAV
jgi:hypothetical protein